MTNHPNRSRPLRESNAELLAALKLAHEEIHHPGSYLHASGGGNIDDVICAAIAKAEGRS